MKIFSYLAVAASMAAVAAPAAAEIYSFKQDGIVFDFRDTVRDGVRIIEGSDSSGATFSYRVENGQVSGVYRGEPVFFAVPSAKSRKLAAR